MRQLHMLIISFLSLALAGPAFGKRDRREGFNFGLGLRAIGSHADTTGRDGENDQIKTGGVQSVTPYFGYVVAERFNIGISGIFENEETHERFKNKAGNQEVRREATSSLKGGGLFTRFLFAQMMFFEGGVGIYDRRQKFVDEYYSRDKEGQFTGERDEYTLRGIGPGYHLGVGLEVAFTNGFYFTTNYTYRAVQLRDYKGSDGIGKKRARLEKRELNFGLAHYLN